jgi:signal transduction histidine kinase
VADDRGSLTQEEMLKAFSVLAHDLKSPLFSIDGFSDLLQTDYEGKLDEEGQDFLQRIRSSVAQAKRVLDEMSSLIKLLARDDSIRPIQLGELVEEIRLRCANDIDEGGVTFSVEGELPTISGDPEKIRHALAALISNAIFFNDRPVGERTVTVSARKFGDDCSICVADNGIGFDPRYKDQLFELGLKLDKQRGGGAGYGLFIARRVAEGHGGRIEVESSPGEGSRFCMVLPVP